ncbi:hypothetical protein PFISCL1PPCAC_16393 [Pristionchus fissidentatus]|uniref:Serine aminopeptidase S33 domain-containing protein n=1 Tax=Pristionchus fissidentatus TaxID=1538716 RepID=A0AAV5VZ62_9BILA|nr:hypothetical protein PFISCL1PPCAC_16393 [Pristionchus fissidentatus]
MDTVSAETESGSDDDFFSKLEAGKNGEQEVECQCPKGPRKSCSQGLWYCGVAAVMTARCCWACCFPPLPNFILSKFAFWPLARNYYFFQETTVDGAAKIIKLNKANKSSLNERWFMGFNHQCFPPIKTGGCEFFTVETKQKHYLACAFVRAPSGSPSYTMIYSHPSGTHLGYRFRALPSLLDIARFLNVDIVVYDYSGYGISSGSYSEKSLFADIEGIYEHVTTVRGVYPQKIVLYGYSIGTASTISLLSEVQPRVAGVILVAPLASMLRVFLWKRACLNKPFERHTPGVDKFTSLEKIGQVDLPLLVCHGLEDTLVPIDHGQALCNAAPNTVPPLWIEDGSHNDMEFSQELWMRMRDFLNRELPTSAISSLSKLNTHSSEGYGNPAE